MTFVTSGELRLWVERIGDRADPAVLLIAGAEGQGIGWPSVLVDRLVAGGLQVIRYDHRDTGESDSVDFDSRPYSMMDLVEDAVAVLDGLDVDSAHVVGASMGGVIAQWLAAVHPGRVLSLTLMSTTAPGRRDLPLPDALFLSRADEVAKLPRGTDEERVEADVQVYELMNGGNLPFDEGAAHDLAQRHFARARDWAKSANHRRISEQRNEPPALTAIKAPTLVIVGEADPIFPPPHAEALAEGIPGARAVRVPGMGHVYFSPGLARLGRKRGRLGARSTSAPPAARWLPSAPEAIRDMLPPGPRTGRGRHSAAPRPSLQELGQPSSPTSYAASSRDPICDTTSAPFVVSVLAGRSCRVRPRSASPCD